MTSRVLGFVVALGLLAIQPSHAESARQEQARKLYDQGRDAFEHEQYDSAYDLFRQSYLHSQRPELLFNMSRALELGGRPHDAAEELRAYLRTVPSTPRRSEIEERVLTLEESQRLIDRDRAQALAKAQAQAKAAEPPPAIVAPTPQPVVVPVAEVVAPAPLVAQPAKSRRGLAIGLGVGAGVIVVGAIVLGVLLSSSHTQGLSNSTFGTIRATP